MKKILAGSMLLAVLVLGCATHIHPIGDVPQGSTVATQRQ